jgi:ABC-type antimicrobial peptide transport system permease subunit
VALVLALIGIYGVTSYANGRRAREVAIRLAVGATPLGTLGLLLWQGARMIAVGLLVGSLAAAGLTRALAGLLYQVRATDPLTFGSVAAILGVTALAACLLPAWRALQVDPMDVLREE